MRRAARRRAAGVLVAAVACALLVGCGGGGEDDAGEGGDAAVDASLPADGREQQRAEAAAVLDEVGEDGPGCAAAVAVGDELVWSGAAGLADVEADTPIDEQTIFDVGSTSKPFTATVVLLLAERGELDLDAPLSDVLDGLPDWADEVTLDQLLHHTAGVPDYVELLADEGYEDADTTTDADALAALGEVDELDFEPGSTFVYSNSGYFLAAEAVEAATGEDFADVVDEELFAPYDLEAVVDPLLDDEAKATSYVDDGGEWVVADSAWEQVGDGGIQTTPAELVRWAAELWDPQIGEAVAEARLDGVVDDAETGVGYGAGISVEEGDDGLVLSHPGAWAGFLSDLVVWPDEQAAAAVTCNTPDLVDPTEAAEQLLEVWSS